MDLNTGIKTMAQQSVLIYVLLTLGSVSVSSQTATVSILPELTSEPREGDAVTLRCEVLDFQSGTHFMSWVAVFPDRAKILTWQGELDSRVTDPAYTVVNNATSDSSSQPEVHSLVINPANQTNNGMYTCRVLEVLNGNSYTVVSSAQIVLTVYPAGIFPVCSPSGAASVMEGSKASCTVAANTSTHVVTRLGLGTQEDWASSSLTPDPGSRLTSTVTDADNDATFNCSSIATDFPDVTLDCQIGPLSVSSPTPAASSTLQSTVYDQTETSALPAVFSPGVVVAVILIVLLIVVAILILAFFLHRRRGRLLPLDKNRTRPTPTCASSPPPEERPEENGSTAPQKPVPYALSKPTNREPVVYASVQKGRGKVSPEDLTEGGIYATVHKEHPAPGKQAAQPVHYASVNMDRKEVPATEPAHYAAVNKRQDPNENTEPAQYAAVQHHGPRSSELDSREDGLVYAELDLVNPPDSENQKPVPKEEPTIYAELAHLK